MSSEPFAAGTTYTRPPEELPLTSSARSVQPVGARSASAAQSARSIDDRIVQMSNDAEPRDVPEPLGVLRTCGLALAFALLATLVYAPALSGPFLSDDIAYLVTHPYTTPLDAKNVRAMFDPFGPAKLYTANYAPVHLLATALERHIFAERLALYHLANVILHAVGAALLVVGLRRLAFPIGVAAFGGAWFLLHPANVEAVAWVSQLKSVGALVLALAAALGFERRPALATLAFVASLLTKASGAFVLPALVAKGLAQRPWPARRWGWIALWTALTVLYAVPQFSAFGHLGAVDVPAYADRGVHGRTILALAARYAVMTVASIGVSAWHEPEPSLAWDAWSVAGLALVLGVGGRAIHCLAQRRVEGACWVAAAAAWVPVSQVFPFATPIADRYVLFWLPGVIAGTLLLGRTWLDRREWPADRMRMAMHSMAALAVAVVVAFGFESRARASLWQSETRLLLDSARNYPDGSSALVLRARSAAHAGDVTGAVSALEAAAARGADRFVAYARDPGLAPIHDAPEFRAFLAASAGRWIDIAPPPRDLDAARAAFPRDRAPSARRVAGSDGGARSRARKGRSARCAARE